MQAHERRRRHALRGLAVGRRLGQGSGRLLREQRRRGAGGAAGDGRRVGVKHFIFSSTAATFGEPGRDADHRGASAASDQPLRRDQAGDRARAAAFRAAYGMRSVVLRYFNAAGADPDGALGEDHHPELHLIPRAIDAALGRDTLPSSASTTHAGRHLPARLRPRHRPRLGPHARARIPARRRAVGVIQSRQRQGRMSVREVLDASSG